MKTALRQEILSILGGAEDLTVATLRADGFPQATTVSYANDGLDIYFGCAANSQKAQNMNRDNRVSLTINLPYFSWSQIRGLSLGGRAEHLADSKAIDHAAGLLSQKFPEGIAEYASGELEGVAFFRIVADVISVLDYSKGFGHAELVKISELTGVEDPRENPAICNPLSRYGTSE